jgi:hypothetical protein
MSLIDTLGTLSMEDVVERDHGHTTTHHRSVMRPKLVHVNLLDVSKKNHGSGN